MALEMTLAKFLGGDVSLNLYINIVILNSKIYLEDPGPWAADIDTLINCLIGAYKD